jgi:carbon-monoxide dehydrogenase medium subunit
VLIEAAGMIGDPSVRNRGTVGGNVAHADPASDLPTVFVCLGATMQMQGPAGSRSVAASQFFTDLFETALGEDEILTAVTVPAESSGTGSAYEKLFNPASRYAVIGVAAQVTMDGDTCTSASVAVGGMTTYATACPSVAAQLVGKTVDRASVEAAAAAVTDDIDPDMVMGDMHASAEYRLGVVPTMVARAINKAVDRAT